MDVTIERLSQQFPFALKKKSEIEKLLEQYTTAESITVAIQQEIEAKVQSLDATVCELESLLTKTQNELTKTTMGPVWNRRIRHLREDVTRISTTLHEHLDDVYRKRGENAERRYLLHSDGLKKREVIAAVESHEREKAKLNESSLMLDTLIQQGNSIVDGIMGQNMTLRSAQRLLGKFRNSIRVSASLIGLVDRRHTVDRLLVYSCMCVTVAVFLILYYYCRLRPSRIQISIQE